MKRLLAVLLSMVLLPFALFPMTEKEALEKFRRTFPRTPIRSVRAFKRIPGLFEVVTEGRKNIIYYYPESNLIIFGEIWTAKGKNLTAERVSHLMDERIRNLDLSKAIKVGNGPVKIVEFTDPDCPFCRRVDDYFLKNSSRITRYIFLFPLPFHKNARKKSLFLICSRDREKALREIADGSWEDSYGKVASACNMEEANKILSEHLKIVRKVGIRGVPVMDIKGKIVIGARMDEIERIVSRNTSKSRRIRRKTVRR